MTKKTKREPTTTFQPRNEYERIVVESAKKAVAIAYERGYKDGRKGVRTPVVVEFKV